MDIRFIFLNQSEAFERWGDGVESDLYGVGCPGSPVGPFQQANPLDTRARQVRSGGEIRSELVCPASKKNL